jgi:hypothetical protein
MADRAEEEEDIREVVLAVRRVAVDRFQQGQLTWGLILAMDISQLPPCISDPA